jgi:hypothetical protein
MKPLEAQESYRLGGREFIVLGRMSPARSDWLIELLDDAGMIRSVDGQLPRIPEGTDPAEWGLGLAPNLARGGRGRLMLGGLLAPAGTADADWTPELARATADFFGRLVEEQDLAVYQALLHSMLAGFFATGLISATTSPSSSTPAESDQPRRDGATGAPSTSGAGATSSAN